ncbi:2-hydroxy-6-oxohepta-2,4-dienoate hydrolase [Crocosphaera subtropica ATCC 51142]|uniref:2-hydroxy-6-oxohepta-2,4-dienoate hydrolase n=1 Tax=Crocosphaera subtropica (strain ATCC 51142 / BH68) TaxID=43989 RepID=B1WQH7_CROS5|nr:alpha/beta hydrolase [Crocosphaera subtropica]ACB51688.1 2-hydroxy-6-oxohepta-2,4-dienoate hydrolase [Crocosphaera subtropica ATCC 51142]
MVFLPFEAKKLTENTSINLVNQIEFEDIYTPLSPQPVSTSYVCQGKGNIPILLIHGFDSSLLEFRRLLPILSQQHQTWAIDLLGFGFTKRNSNLLFSPENIKTHLYCTWKNLIEQPVILVGASMGGATAIDFTLTYPDAVKKLVLIDSAGLAAPPKIGKLMFPPLDYLSTAFLRNLTVRQKISESAYYDKRFASKDAQLCAALHLNCERWSQSLISFTKSGGYGSFKEEMVNIKQETLIIWGENDKILGTKDADKFNELIPDSQLIWIPKCGHVPHLEKAELTAEAILN